jgi:predicted aspartyl protease
MSLALILCLTATAAPLADIPFDDDFGLVFFELQINGSEPVAFFLDTGFDFSIVDTDVAARLGLEVLETKNEAQPGGSVEMSRLAPSSLSIGKLEIENVHLTAAPLSGAASFIGREFGGILGHDVLERFVVDIDYPNRRLRFLAPENWDHAGPGQVLPVTILDNEVFVNAGIAMPAGRTVFGPFKLDTGSLDVAGLNLNFVQDSALIEPGTLEVSVGGVAMGGSTEGRMFRAEAFIFGAHRIEQPVIGYTVDSAGFENRDDAGTFGAAVLSRYRLILDYKRNRIIVENGPRMTETVHEDLSGLLVVSPGPAFETLAVAQVIPGSPADEAGLAPGDEIVSMDDRSDWTLREIRTAFETPGPVQIVISREGESRESTLIRRPVVPRN